MQALPHLERAAFSTVDSLNPRVGMGCFNCCRSSVFCTKTIPKTLFARPRPIGACPWYSIQGVVSPQIPSPFLIRFMRGAESNIDLRHGAASRVRRTVDDDRKKI